MDSRIRSQGLLIGALALVLSAVTAAGRAPSLAALVWTDSAASRSVLLRQPATCLRGDSERIALGRVLFNAPQLLGGQAARAGISCASCHANGRRSAHFFLDGVSGAPGTADVSASFFSAARANERFDPQPIPDLAKPGKIARDSSARTLEHFLRGLIVEEFAGREPEAGEIEALAAYVRAIAPCEGGADEPRRMREQIELATTMVRLAAVASTRGEARTATILVGGARHQLGLLYERLADPQLGAERALVLSASRQLQPGGVAPAPTPAALRSWEERFRRDIVPHLLRAEPRSLYAPSAAEVWLAAVVP